MKRTRWLLAGSLLLAVSACTTTGTGGGEIAGAGKAPERVSFNWTSNDGGISGVMTALLPGQTFSGRFFQITEQTRSEVLVPLWTHWPLGWYDWPYWDRHLMRPYPFAPAFPYPYPTPQFITHYSGKVVATLEAEGRQRLRCRFDLVEPARGMGGGGDGECQLSDGRTVRADFAPK